MADHRHEHDEHDMDAALRARLARLASVPVDTAGFERRLRDAIAGETGQHPRLGRRPRAWRPALALAAGLLLAVSVGVILITSSASPTIAAPADLAQVHQSIGSAQTPVFAVTSIDQANQVLSERWANAPALPRTMPEAIRGCCISKLSDRRVACVLMEEDQIPVTLVVARNKDLRSMGGATVERNGRRYVVHEMDGIQMVMAQIDGQYVCVMGRLPAERLLQIADGLKF